MLNCVKLQCFINNPSKVQLYKACITSMYFVLTVHQLCEMHRKLSTNGKHLVYYIHEFLHLKLSALLKIDKTVLPFISIASKRVQKYWMTIVFPLHSWAKYTSKNCTEQSKDTFSHCLTLHKELG